MDFATKLPFARDRVVEAYFWALGVYFEPEYYFARMISAKATSIITVIDDIYDVHGTYEELESFTEAIERFRTGQILYYHTILFSCIYVYQLIKYSYIYINSING